MPKVKNTVDNDDYIAIEPLQIQEYTTITIHHFRSAPLTIWVFDSSGTKISVIFDGWLTKGNHSIQWYAEAFNGKRLTKGEYEIRIKSYQKETTLLISIF